MWAAWELADADEYWDSSAQLLTRLAEDTDLDDDYYRLRAACSLAGIRKYQTAGADRLISFADDATFDFYNRMTAAERLADIDEYRDRAAQLLIRLTEDTDLDAFGDLASRIRAIRRSKKETRTSASLK